jgi:hypothetical protein
MTVSRPSLSLVLALAASTATAAAADVAFVGPSGWSHMGQQSPDQTRKFDQWKLGGGGNDPAQTVTFISDTTSSYADALALIKKNFADNHIKASADADTTCHGKQGHVIEFSSGPEGKEIVIKRILIPQDPSGLITITYARAKDDPYDDDVKKSIETFCKAS